MGQAIGKGVKKNKLGKRKKNVDQPTEPTAHTSRTESTISSTKCIKARALYNYYAENFGDLQFRIGDILIVLSELTDQWWKAKHTMTLQIGYIPSNYVVIDDGSPTSLDGWFDISRAEADKNLLRPGLKDGTYIIRPSSEAQHWAISIRYFGEKEDYHVVKHYKIRSMDQGGYYINVHKHFTDMESLIDHYSKSFAGLCCALTDPFPRTYQPVIGFRELEVKRDCLTMVSKLGNGNFGDVWLAKRNRSVQVAVKMLKENAFDENQREEFLKEAKLMHQLHHPRIVEILGVCSEPPVLIITELMVNGALLGYLRNDEGQKLVLSDMLLMMNQIADGMSYLESKNFLHRDLRAANILVGEDVSVKVADFGLARVTESVYECNQASKFPVKWTAPEAGLRQLFSIKSDVWSFGVLMFEIVTYGITPYPGMVQKTVLNEVDNGYRMPNPNGGKVHCPNEVYQIMLSCWDAKPADRPTFRTLRDVFEEFAVATENNYE